MSRLIIVFAVLAATCIGAPAFAEEPTGPACDECRKELDGLKKEVEDLQNELDDLEEEIEEAEEELAELIEERDEQDEEVIRLLDLIWRLEARKAVLEARDSAGTITLLEEAELLILKLRLMDAENRLNRLWQEIRDLVLETDDLLRKLVDLNNRKTTAENGIRDRNDRIRDINDGNCSH